MNYSREWLESWLGPLAWSQYPAADGGGYWTYDAGRYIHISAEFAEQLEADGLVRREADFLYPTDRLEGLLS
jgi:hypothetical protein